MLVEVVAWDNWLAWRIERVCDWDVALEAKRSVCGYSLSGYRTVMINVQGGFSLWTIRYLIADGDKE